MGALGKPWLSSDAPEMSPPMGDYGMMGMGEMSLQMGNHHPHGSPLSPIGGDMMGAAFHGQVSVRACEQLPQDSGLILFHFDLI